MLIFKSPAVYSADDLKGLMHCTIKGIKLIQINEGRHEEFSGIKGASKIGDSFTITYDNTETSHFNLRISTNFEKPTIF